MKRFLIPMLLSGALLAGCSEEKGGQNPDEPTPPAQEETVKPYTDVEPLEAMTSWTLSADEEENMASLGELAFKLNKAMSANYASLWADNTGNYSFSPLSISVYLAALSQCVDGQARQDLCAMLGMDEADVTALSNKLLRYLQQDNSVANVSLANSVWHNPLMPISDSFKQRMAEQFGAPVNALDMYSSECVDVLNAWGSDKTRGMIPKFLNDAPNVDFMVANALYFSAAWISNFYEGNTQNEIFHGANGDREAAMMHGAMWARYATLDGLEYAGLPFACDYQMDIIIPSDSRDFSERLDADLLALLEETASAKTVVLSLPRFSDNREAEIQKVLKSLGYPAYNMPTLEMTGRDDVPLLQNNSFVKHVTALNVNEKGAELAAITAGGFAGSTGEEQEVERVEMRVDRPFYYIIRNTKCNAILMIGRVNNL